MFAAYSKKDDSNLDQSSSSKAEEGWLKNASFGVAQSSFSSSQLADTSGNEHTSNSKKTQQSQDEYSKSKDHNKQKMKSDGIKKKKKKKKKDEKDSNKTNITASVKLKADSREHCKNIKTEFSNKSVRKSVFSNGMHLRHDEAFFEDLKGDRDNFAFPNMYFKNVARHHQTKGILGIDYWKKSSLKKPKPPRYFGKRALRRLAKVVHALPIQPQLCERNPLGIYDANTVMYIEGHHTTESKEEQSLGIKEEVAVIRQTALFNEKLRENPHDIELWLSFVEHQDVACFMASEENAGETSTNQFKKQKRSHHRALLERKISILDKAILHNPKSIKLISARLKIAAEFWDAAALHQEWRNMLFVNPTSIQLWKEYLIFVESYFEGFSVAQVLKGYANCIQKLTQMQQPSFASHQRPPNLEESMIDIGIRLCSFLRLSGWTEKSVSLAQALLELSFKRPDDFSPPLAWLKSLWEHHVPRIGEEDAGSNTTRIPIRIVHGIDLAETEDAIVNSGQAFPVVWRQVEFLRSREQWQACSDRSDCDDEERAVSFNDISQYLFFCEKRSGLQFRLVVGCLLSLGAPLLPASQVQLFWSPLVKEDNLLCCLPSLPKVASLSGSLPGIMNSASYMAFLRLIVLQSFRLLKQPHKMELALWWLNVEQIRMSSITHSSTLYDINRSWKETKNWLKNFLKEIPSSDVVSTVMLYNGYAKVEREIGNGEESQRIFQMLLQMYSSNPLMMKSQQGHRAALIQTWFNYTKFFLQNIQKSNHHLALNHLVALGVGSSFSAHPANPTPAMLLKAKRKYETLLLDMAENIGYTCDTPFFSQPDEVVELLGCYSYFLSLTEGCRAAYQMIQRWLESSQRTDFHFVAENRYKADFLSYHSRREAVYVTLLDLLSVCRDWVKDLQPRLFYDSLCIALAEYPDSMQLLAVLIQSKERCSMFSGLWNNLITRAKATGNKSSSLAALAACLALACREETVKRGEERTLEELASHSGGIATLHLGYRRKLEHLAEHCVAQYPCRHVPVLWRILMYSAFLAGDTQRCKALFYRAVRDCPTSKDIFMDIIGYLPPSIKEVTSLMIEKDLRLRFPLEELQVLLEAEKEEDLEELPPGPTVEDAVTSVEEYTEVKSSQASEESEDNFSDDFQQDSDEDDAL